MLEEMRLAYSRALSLLSTKLFTDSVELQQVIDTTGSSEIVKHYFSVGHGFKLREEATAELRAIESDAVNDSEVARIRAALHQASQTDLVGLQGADVHDAMLRITLGSRKCGSLCSSYKLMLGHVSAPFRQSHHAQLIEITKLLADAGDTFARSHLSKVWSTLQPALEIGDRSCGG